MWNRSHPSFVFWRLGFLSCVVGLSSCTPDPRRFEESGGNSSLDNSAGGGQGTGDAAVAGGQVEEMPPSGGLPSEVPDAGSQYTAPDAAEDGNTQEDSGANEAEPEEEARVDAGAGEPDAQLEAGMPAEDASLAEVGTSELNDGGQGATPQLLDELVLFLPMEEEAWGGANFEVEDRSEYHNHGRSFEGATTTAQGKLGRGGSFDGLGYVGVPDDASLRPSQQLTMSAWLNPTRIGQDQDGNDVDSHGIISKRISFSNESSYTMYLAPDGQLRCDIQMEEDRFGSVQVLQPNQWTHVALVYDGRKPAAERARLYINGELDVVAAETSSQISPTFGADVVIGALPGGGSHFIGGIDEVAIWTRSLTDTEVAELASATQSLVP